MRIVPGVTARICSTVSRSAEKSSNPVNAFMKENPMFCGVTVACTKAGGADLITQTTLEGNTWSEVDWRRVGLFFAWGFAYQGVVTYYMYVKGFPLLFPGVAKFCNLPFREKLKDTAGLITLTKQVFLDIAVINPVLFWPVYYGFKEYFFRPERDTREFGQIISDTFEKYKATFWVDNLGMAGFWAPANYVIYALPLHLRLPVNHSVAFVWCGLLSFFRGKNNSDETITAESAAIRA
jgi:hypothetical protein